MRKVFVYISTECKNEGKWYCSGGWGVILQAYVDKDEWECSKCDYKGKLESFEDTEHDGDVLGTCPKCDRNGIISQTSDPSVPVATNRFRGTLTHRRDTDTIDGVRVRMYAVLMALKKVVKRCRVHVQITEMNFKENSRSMWNEIYREIERLKCIGGDVVFVREVSLSSNLQYEAREMARLSAEEAEFISVGICRPCRDNRKVCGFPPENMNNCDGYEPRSSVEKKFEVCKECLNYPFTCGYEPMSERHCEGEDSTPDWDDVKALT